MNPMDPSRPQNSDLDNTLESASRRGSEELESSSTDSPEPMDQDINGGARPEAISPFATEFVEDNIAKTIFEPDDAEAEFEVWSSDTTSPEEDEQEIEAFKFKNSWSENVRRGNIVNLKFMGCSGIGGGLSATRKYSILECFKLFIDDDIINLMVTETNKNARAKFIHYGYHEGYLSGWLDVTFKEMTQFIGLIIFMAFKRLPDTTLYWSTDRLYFNSVACRIFTQTRFHRILSFWYFGNDGTESPYAKINTLLSRLNDNFRKYKQPPNILYVMKNTIYLRNKFANRTESDINSLRLGTKILKAMDQEVYTYKVVMHPPDDEVTRSEQIKSEVLELLDDYLDQGRLIIIHNLYVSVELADELLKRKSHSMGIMRRKSRGTPKCLATKKIKDGDLIGYQNPDGICVMKWRVAGQANSNYGITTCHTLDSVSAQKKSRKRSGNTSPTPVKETMYKFIRDIGLRENVFDTVNKHSISTSPLNDQVKWYQRTIADLIVNTVTINALSMYKKLNKEKIKMWDFRDKLFRELVDIRQLPNVSSEDDSENIEFDE